MAAPILFHWLGTAGIELTVHDRVLVVDPYFTRCSFWKVWFGFRVYELVLLATLGGYNGDTALYGETT
jgi:L-ascorbate metabolism protein UlaG (beta-lactamase superfamily)